MAKQTSEHLMREELPYGMYRYENGSKQLFNRRYEPIRQKGPEPEGEPVDQVFYFADHNPPWRNLKTKAYCESVLRRWDRP